MKMFCLCCAISLGILSAAPAAWAQNPPTSGGVWLKGDLHAHSNQSDGINSVTSHVDKAEDLGFDFYVITDHDNSPLTMGDPVHWYNAGYTSNSVILLYGMEWTTGDGHANVWKDVTFDYTDLWQANRDDDADAAQLAAAAEGALFSINHPEETGHEWNYPINYLPDAVELWQLPFLMADLTAFQGHAFYDGLLRDGNRVPFVGGSDTHTLTTSWWWLFGSKHQYSGLGKPTTWLYAQDDTGAEVIQAISDGRATVTYSPTGPRLEFRADTDDDGQFDDAMMGDNLAVQQDPVEFEAKVTGNPGGGSVIDFSDLQVQYLLNGTLRWVDIKNWLAQVGYTSYDLLLTYKNGSLFHITALVQGANTYTFTDTPDTLDYYRVELHRVPTPNPGGGTYTDGVTAVANPIYFGF